MDDQLTPKQQAFVAAFISDANFNATEAARVAGYSSPRASGTENLANPIIKQIINQHLDTLRDAGIANRAVRIAKLNTLNEKLEFVMNTRSREMVTRFENGEDLPEYAESGLMVETVKQVGTGPNAVVTTEWTFDHKLYESFLKTQEQAAKEAGDRDKRIELSGPNGGPLQVESGKAKLLELLDEQES